MRRRLAAAVLTCLLTCLPAFAADPLSDAPEPRVADERPVQEAPSYAHALGVWRRAEDVNAWIGAKFEYDTARAMLLSETQRKAGSRFEILAPDRFFAAPRGVCVDLARFAVEALRAIEPDSRPSYLMIEFSPVTIAGNTLRRHWLASFQRGGQHYFFADSKRPGLIAGPYASTREFIEEYARYRGREIVAFRELDSYERKTRMRAARPPRQERPDPDRP